MPHGLWGSSVCVCVSHAPLFSPWASSSDARLSAPLQQSEPSEPCAVYCLPLLPVAPSLFISLTLSRSSPLPPAPTVHLILTHSALRRRRERLWGPDLQGLCVLACLCSGGCVSSFLPASRRGSPSPSSGWEEVDRPRPCLLRVACGHVPVEAPGLVLGVRSRFEPLADGTTHLSQSRDVIFGH